MPDTTPTVAVCIVSFNSGRDLPTCLRAVAAQSFEPAEIVIVDCASTDDSVEIARAVLRGRGRVIELDSNLGFAGGANRAIGESTASHILLLNPDASPSSDYLEQLVKRVARSGDLRVGSVTGRLQRETDSEGCERLDACGMRLRPTWRHLDRGSGLVDRGQFAVAERVFGATGAASLFSRAALEDVAFEDGVFAPEFHSFREDAELCFRLQERDWVVIYEPNALCIHRRGVTPRGRLRIDPEINFHSLKNRYLLRAYHQDLPNLLITFVPTLLRDLLALVWVVAMERTSLAAYRWLWQQRHRIKSRRRSIMRRRTCSSLSITRWFFRSALPL
ncbi:MAG: glycosyltransferase family 2 protein [Acidobacteriota bacterium]